MTTPAPRLGATPVRVQVPAYTDAWWQGDRFGEVVRITKGKRSAGRRAMLLARDRWNPVVEIATVLLDRSGRRVRVILADCEVV